MTGYNFTAAVRRALAEAREESARLHHEYVGTEHILLGLTREPSRSGAGDLFDRLHVDPLEIRRSIEGAIKPGRASAQSAPDLPYTSRAKKVLELAMKEANELGHSYVGTEHLLLGLLREEKGIGAQVLAHAGVTHDALRAAVLGRSAPEGDIQTSSSFAFKVVTSREPSRAQKALAWIAFAFGVIWAITGAMKLIFGTAITFVLLPPLGLENVSAGKSLIIALGLFAIGAILRRKRIW